MKKAATLRAGEEFRRTLLHGRRIGGQMLRCHYLVHGEGGPPVQVGFVVPSARYNAARRNRIKRLLREAYLRERPSLADALARKRKRVSLIFFFRGDIGSSVQKLRLHAVQEQVAILCRSLVIELESQEQCQES